jgi:hypothetical protein
MRSLIPSRRHIRSRPSRRPPPAQDPPTTETGATPAAEASARLSAVGIRRTRIALGCLALALLLASCGSGGVLGPRSLAKQSDAVQSLAAEGALLAQDGVDGNTTAIFSREHGGFLSKAATSTASSLAKARTSPALVPKLRRLQTLSASVRDQLRRFGGASRAEEREIARTLRRAADEAGRLSKSLG